jgi:hypothetical protein
MFSNKKKYLNDFFSFLLEYGFNSDFIFSENINLDFLKESFCSCSLRSSTKEFGCFSSSTNMFRALLSRINKISKRFNALIILKHIRRTKQKAKTKDILFFFFMLEHKQKCRNECRCAFILQKLRRIAKNIPRILDV